MANGLPQFCKRGKFQHNSLPRNTEKASGYAKFNTSKPADIL